MKAELIDSPKDMTDLNIIHRKGTREMIAPMVRII
jgi:hypothetical protein